MVAGRAPGRGAERDLRLYRSSVLVTGGHYTLTTVIARLLACSPRFHTVTEPGQPFAPLWFRTLGSPHHYVYHDEAAYPELRAGLIRLMLGRGWAKEALSRALRVRSPGVATQVAAFTRRELKMRLSPRPAIFKAPYLTFSARSMQRADGMRVVLGMRHPCAWIESIVRRDRGFDFRNLLQPALLEALPEHADAIDRFAHEDRPALEQAILAWRVFQTFHARYLLGDERTLVVRQHDLVGSPRGAAERLFRFAGVDAPAGLDAFLRNAFEARRVDFTPGGPGRYTERDGRAVVEKWRQRLTPEEVALIRRETEELAAAFGYDETHWTDLPARG